MRSKRNKQKPNKTELMKKYIQTGITVKNVYKSWCQRDFNHAEARHASFIAARHGQIRSSQWRKPQKLQRPSFEWKSKSLLQYSFRSVERKGTEFTAAKFSLPRHLEQNTAPREVVIMLKKLQVFMSHKLVGFHHTFNFKILCLDWKTTIKC